MRPRRPLLPTGAVTAALLLLVGALGACSSDASTRTAAAADGPTTTAPPVTVPEEIPPGTTLRIGDQLGYLQTVLEIAGQDQGFDYEVSYSAFVGGPPMLQAFQGDAIDSGFIASTPLIFAQAAGQEIVAIAGWAAERGLGGLLSVDDDIDGWGDLAGKRVAYQRGTSAEAAFLQGLDAAGVDPADVTTVDVPLTQVSAALQSGSADAAVSYEPLASTYLADHPEARLVAVPDEITDRANFLIASADALDDPGRTAALADYTTRLVAAFAWISEHPGALAEAIFVEQYGLPAARAQELVDQGNGSVTFFALPGEVAEQQQVLADLFHAAGQIPAELDVAAEFDTRFNDLVEEAQP